MKGLTDAEKAIIAYLELCAETPVRHWNRKEMLIYDVGIAIMQQMPPARLNEIMKEYAR
jgi:hypothetical protein